MIPIMRPKLPSADRISPYLRSIDETRIYSNFGPLTLSLEDRLSSHFGFTVGSVATVTNATIGLTLALQAQGARPGTLCAMPAWTFVGSAHAVMLAGLTPYFIDVDPVTWALAPEAIDDALAGIQGRVGAVMPVFPFGQPIDVAAWDLYGARTGLPVVIDGAAAFDALKPGRTPAVVSLHATKVLGVSEGGFVISEDAKLVRDVRTRSNFGFAGTREATVPSVNAKLSEYHAAVGHAALDEWYEARAEWMVAAGLYRQAFAESNQIRLQPGFGDSWVTSTCILRLDYAAVRAEHALAAAQIETRRWWGLGAHAHQATMSLPRGALPATQTLAETTIAVPFSRDLGSAVVDRVVDCLRSPT
jgi:dTDP-4-amino-4,6-dideoxygalactose transaminase